MRRSKVVVPDGGWGWFVVFGAALTNMATQSIFGLFGLLYGEKIEQMGHGTIGAALVMNINSMVTNFSGIITGPLLKKYSTRLVSVTGVLLVAFGLIFSSFATSLIHLIITYSAFTGLGLGLIMPSTFLAVNSYFTKRRSHAVGISMAGTGIGQMLMPQVVRFLLDEYGYSGATLIMGALSLHGLAGSLFFQPIEWHMKCTDEPQEETILLQNTNNIKIEEDCTQDKTEESVCRRVANVLDLELLKDPIFVHIIIGLSVVYTSGVAFSMLFPFYLQKGIGLTRAQTALSMSLLSAADIAARLTIPLIATRLQLGNRITFLYGALMLALCRSLLAEQTTLETVLAVSVLCGYVRAATVVNQNLTVSEYCDEKQLPAALGLNMVTKGLVVLTLGQFFGWIRDYTSSFTVCIHSQSVFLVAVAFTWSIEIAARRIWPEEQE